MADETTPPDDTASLAGVLRQIRELVGLTDAAGLSLETLQQRTRRQLLDWAHRLGLTGLQRLTKEALASRLRDALARLGVVPEPPASAGTGLALPQKFDLGLPRERVRVAEHIPWGYGRDRVTAMVIDPDRLYVYWEATDEAIARARAGLGAGGADAWLNLRVYDVTGRLFDGTNAHGYVDQKVERGDRQWFFTIGKPTSAAVVEAGMKSLEGYFVRIARSGRADFPRREPAPPGGVEWLTVRTPSGPVAPPASGGPAPGGLPEGGAVAAPAGLPEGGAVTAPAGPDGGGLRCEERFVPGETFESAAEWKPWFRNEWGEGGRHLEWRSPALRATWEAGPFSEPVESPAYVEERHDGTVTVYTRDGHTRVVYGPWHVVIRGLGAHAERRIVATWEMVRSWAAGATVEPAAATWRPAGGSELRLRGASEVYLLGASEWRARGASERVRAGASERRLGGASERLVKR